MISHNRIHVPPAPRQADSNIRTRYAIENAAWIWHPDAALGQQASLLFRLEFELDKAETIRVHLSADQRYELTIDGKFTSMGPDRSDPNHWSFASYDLELEAGKHSIEALVWWIGQQAPNAQMSIRGGFIFSSESHQEIFNTGQGAWTVEEVAGWSYKKHSLRNYHVIGPSHIINGKELHAPRTAVEPMVVSHPIWVGRTGEMQGIWNLYPSPLPDMIRRPVSAGRIRAVGDQSFTQTVKQADIQSPEIPAWQDLLDEKSTVTIPPHTKQYVLWDFDEYYCGYSSLTFSGGAGSRVGFEWAESLFEVKPGTTEPAEDKNNRKEIVGKVFYGFGDQFLPDGGEHVEYRSFWWRSGRYIHLSIETGDQPLRIDNLEIIETRYPIESEMQWRSDDSAMDAAIPPMIRVLQMCMHETYMDCPYYEQMMYVGDTRLQMLVANVLGRDTRLTKRGIELFDWSRWKTGFVAERYPSDPLQQSLTFAMIWVAMVRDYAWWQDDAPWVRERMIGVRCLIENFLPLLNEDNLLENIPGWSFVDWIAEWDGNSGYPADAEFGVSSIVNLLFVQALRSAAELEEAHGDKELQNRYLRIADTMSERIVKHFWVEEKSLLADDLIHENYSEHAQCLALINDVLPGNLAEPAFNSLITDNSLRRTTIYFQFYLFEAFYRFGRGDLIQQKLDLWKDQLANDLKTTVEAPEPTRSDCHAWGAHPLFHFHASLAGIRPAAPGFKQVRIAPSPGPLTEIQSTLPHPRGEIQFALKEGEVKIILPSEVTGSFEWNGDHYELSEGDNLLTISI